MPSVTGAYPLDIDIHIDIDIDGGGGGVLDLAVLRVDGDGQLDLIVSARLAPLRLWQNRGEAGHWLAWSHGRTQHRAVGAWIEAAPPPARRPAK